MFRPSGGHHQVVHSEVDSKYNVYNLYLHIVLRIYFRVHNLMIATWGPKHVVAVNSIPPMLSN